GGAFRRRGDTPVAYRGLHVLGPRRTDADVLAGVQAAGLRAAMHRPRASAGVEADGRRFRRIVGQGIGQRDPGAEAQRCDSAKMVTFMAYRLRLIPVRPIEARLLRYSQSGAPACGSGASGSVAFASGRNA